MRRSELLVSILLGMGALQGFFLVLSLSFRKKVNRPSTAILIALVLVITLVVFQNFIGFSGYYLVLPHLVVLFYPLNAVIGPLFLFYVLFVIQPSRRLKWRDLAHLVLFFVLLWRHKEFILSPASAKIQIAEFIYFGDSRQSLASVMIFLFIKSYTILYPLAAVYIVRKKIAELKTYTSNTLIGHLEWLQSFSFAFAIFIALSMVATLTNYMFGAQIDKLETYIHLINALFIHFIAFVAMGQPEKLFYVFADPVPRNGETSARLPVERVLSLMEEEKPYLEPDLKIHDFAAMLNVPPYSLSEQINKQMGINFYEFVNRYRIEEFKKRVISDKYRHLTLLAIALDVGFNSKASFNRIFKKHTGRTPSQFVNSAKEVSTSKVESNPV